MQVRHFIEFKLFDELEPINELLSKIIYDLALSKKFLDSNSIKSEFFKVNWVSIVFINTLLF